MVRRGPLFQRLHHGDPNDPPQYDVDRVDDYDINPIRHQGRDIDRRSTLTGTEGFLPVPTV